MAWKELFVNVEEQADVIKGLEETVMNLGGYVADRYLAGSQKTGQTLVACTVRVPESADLHRHADSLQVYDGHVPSDVIGSSSYNLAYALNWWNADVEQREQNVARGEDSSVDALIVMKRPRATTLRRDADKAELEFDEAMTENGVYLGGSIISQYIGGKIASYDAGIPKDKVAFVASHPLVKALYTRPVSEVEIKRSRDLDFKMAAGVWNARFRKEITPEGEAEALSEAMRKGGGCSILV